MFTKCGSFDRDFHLFMHTAVSIKMPTWLMINPREFASLWDVKAIENFSCFSLKVVADYLVAITLQTRIAEPFRSGADRK